MESRVYINLHIALLNIRTLFLKTFKIVFDNYYTLLASTFKRSLFIFKRILPQQETNHINLFIWASEMFQLTLCKFKENIP